MNGLVRQKDRGNKRTTEGRETKEDMALSKCLKVGETSWSESFTSKTGHHVTCSAARDTSFLGLLISSSTSPLPCQVQQMIPQISSNFAGI